MIASSRFAARRRGLTLMELIVVLVILIALAGIVIPLLPSMLGRAETGSGATSQTEITKWVQTYEQLYLSYPKDWDALVDSSEAFVSYVRGGTDISVDTLAPGEADALKNAGIDRLQLMVATPDNCTFDPYGATDYFSNGLTPADGKKLVFLTDTAPTATKPGGGQSKLNLLKDGTTSSGRYVVFGFGKRSSIIGKSTSNAPVVFRDSAGKTPEDVYCRYGVVFQVSNTAGPLERARFVGVCNFKKGGIFTSDDDLEEFYHLNNGGA